MSTMFLEPNDLKTLTGRGHKRLQIEQLRTMAIPFFINADGWPMVAKSFFEGATKRQTDAVLSKKEWVPIVIKG